MTGARFGCTTATRSRSSDSRGTSDPGRRPVRSPAPRAPESCGLRQSPGSRARDERVERRRKRQRRQERPASVVCSWLLLGFRNYGDVWVEPIPLLAEEGWLRQQKNAAKRPKRRSRGGQTGATFRRTDPPGASRHPSSASLCEEGNGLHPYVTVITKSST